MVLYILVLFVIVYSAVRLAINPLIYKPNNNSDGNQDYDLSKLHDIGLLSDEEFSKIIDLYWNKESRNENAEYKNACKVLFELKNKGLFSTEEYNDKVVRLKQYYNINQL